MQQGQQGQGDEEERRSCRDRQIEIDRMGVQNSAACRPLRGSMAMLVNRVCCDTHVIAEARFAFVT